MLPNFARLQTTIFSTVNSPPAGLDYRRVLAVRVGFSKLEIFTQKIQRKNFILDWSGKSHATLYDFEQKYLKNLE